MSSEETVVSSAKRRLRSEGKRITPQRALVLQIIEESDGHLDADEIYRRARARDPRLSLSTVYRTLSVLKELDLVREFHFAEEHHHYEIKDQAEHYHLICSRCGKIVEFESLLAEKLKAQIGREHDFRVDHVHIDLAGLCAQCQQG